MIGQQKTHNKISRDDLTFILLGLIGFSFGLFIQPTWQRAVEFGQILSGIIQYPADNVYYLFVKNSWNGINQAIAILLKLGISEEILSYGISGLIGALVFLSLGMISYGLTESTLVAILFPLFIIVTNVYHGTGAAVYPIYLVGQVHTHGIIGYLTVFLIIGTFVCRKYLMAGFLIGLMPTVHLGLFILTLPVFILVILMQAIKAGIPKLLRKGLFIGLAISLVSLIFYQFARVRLPNIDTNTARTYLLHFVSTLDAHRKNISPYQPSVYFNYLSVIYPIILLSLEGKRLPYSIKCLLQFILIFGILSLLSMRLSYVPIEKQPTFLIKLMPGRIMGINHVLISIAVLSSYKYMGLYYRIIGIFIIGILSLAYLRGFIPTYCAIFISIEFVCMLVIIFKEVENYRICRKQKEDERSVRLLLKIMGGGVLILSIAMFLRAEIFRFPLIGRGKIMDIVINIWLASLLSLESINLLSCKNICCKEMAISISILWLSIILVMWWEYYRMNPLSFGRFSYAVLALMTIRDIFWNNQIFYKQSLGREKSVD